MVSIVVTCHNYGHFLAETLASIAAQTYKDWECIVIDSGSTDNTKDVAESFTSSDNRFKYLYKSDEGVSSARNAGLKNCRGEFIQFIDGDDQIQKNKIASQLMAFEQLPEADIVYGNVRFYDTGSPSDLRTSLKGDKPDDWLPKLSGRGQVVFSLLKSYNFLVTLSPLVRRRLIEQVGGFDESIPALEDWDFWQRCSLKGAYFHFHANGDDLSLVRVHSGSLSRKTDLMLRGKFLLYQKRIVERNTGGVNRLYFILKYAELFWNTAFSYRRVPRTSFLFFVFNILLFPVWILIKVYRLIRK